MALRSSPAKRYGGLSEEVPYYTRGGPTLLALTPSNDDEKAVTKKEEQDWAILFNHLEQRFQALYTWRLPVWNVWGQIARYQLPRRYYAWSYITNTYSQGLRQDWEIVDRTATIAGDRCAAGLMAGLTDPDRKWLVLGPAIPNFELDADGQAWYEEVTERINYVLTHSNFYESQAQFYEDLVFFGTATVIDYPDRDQIIRSVTPCAGEYLLATGFDFSNEVFNREYRMTVSQIVEMFGVENCPQDVLEMWREKGGALEYQYAIRHSIEPNFPVDGYNNDASVGVVPGGFTWREVYWVSGHKNSKPLSMTGFHEQPFATACWNTQGNEAYGRGLGEDALGDTIQLQLETRQKAEALEKMIRPPMGADASLANQPSSTRPGEITYMNAANGEKKFWALYETKFDVPGVSADILLIQERIAKTFFNDVFQPMEDLRNETHAQITATEIDAIKEERLLPLGPVFGRIYASVRQRIMRIVRIMDERGIIPPKPASIRGVPTELSFISMLTAAQKATGTAAIARTVQFAGSMSGVYPESRFAIDPIEAIREFNDGVGATSKILRPKRQIQKMMQQEQQQNAANAALAQTAAGAQSAETLSKASLAPGSALAALVPGQGA